MLEYRDQRLERGQDRLENEMIGGIKKECTRPAVWEKEHEGETGWNTALSTPGDNNASATVAVKVNCPALHNKADQERGRLSFIIPMATP